MESQNAGGEALQVITLASSHAPIPLPKLDLPCLAGTSVFRSQRTEEGRARYRIHIGYFLSVADAEAVLPAVREAFPWAFVGPSPNANLGSLDDTTRTRFVAVAAAENVNPAPHPVPPPAPAASHAPATKVRRLATRPVAAQARTKEPPLLPLSDAVIQTLPAAPQRYAVQLIWSKDRIDLRRIPSVRKARGLHLYSVTTGTGANRMHGVRMGFYDDPLSARLVALRMRATFKAVIVPVSEREVQGAIQASQRLREAHVRADESPATRSPVAVSGRTRQTAESLLAQTG